LSFASSGETVMLPDITLDISSGNKVAEIEIVASSAIIFSYSFEVLSSIYNLYPNAIANAVGSSVTNPKFVNATFFNAPSVASNISKSSLVISTVVI
jgi:hypothetical protein